MKNWKLCILAVAVVASTLLAKHLQAAEQPASDGVVVNDFMCGLHRVQISDSGGLLVDETAYGDYKGSELDHESSYIHRFGDKAELRVTQFGRVAFRLAGETRWASCKPLVFYKEATK